MDILTKATLIFVLAGAAAMSGALFARRLLHMPEEERHGWTAGNAGAGRVLLLGNICALLLVASLVYGFIHLAWWLPLICLVMTFPVIQRLLLEPWLKPGIGLLGCTLLAVVFAVWMGLDWWQPH